MPIRYSVLLLVLLIAIESHGLLISSSRGLRRGSSYVLAARARSSESDTQSDSHGNALVTTPQHDKTLKKLIASGVFALSLCNPVNAAGPTLASLETAITSLESATNRADAVQGMADVFEAAGTKTLLVRTKYKSRIISAINNQHKSLNNEWDSVLGYESGELKRRVDPFRTVDLKGYLQIAPLVGGACYLGALFVQQAIPEAFVFAYPVAVFVFAAPIIFTVLTT
jgi:hypothetical protein